MKTDKIEIEKGIPVPEDYRKQRKKYPIPEMEVGDSFSIDVTNKTRFKIETLRSSILASARRVEGKFITYHNKAENKIQCWKVK